MVHYHHTMKETKFEATIFRQYNIDRSMTKHRRTRRRLNLHTLFLSFKSSNNICSLPLIASNIVNVVQFGKGMVKIWGVWCKGVQCLVIGELKWIRTSSLKSYSLHLCLWNRKKFCKALVGAPIKFQIIQNK